MTAHVNEFNPTSKTAQFGVQSDSVKLKFNNIKSCIAVGLLPKNGGPMIGIHFTTMSSRSDNELKVAIDRASNLAGNGKCDAYLVANFSFHRSTNLVTKLKTICTNVYLCDVPPVETKDADVDVKMEKSGTGVKVYIRPHVLKLTDDAGKRILKTKYATTADIPKSFLQSGKSAYQNDRDSKPWMLASFKKIA